MKTTTEKKPAKAKVAKPATDEKLTAEKKTGHKKTIIGLVVSDKTSKTIVIKVDNKFVHPIYGKSITRSKKFHAHDEAEKAEVGNMVTIIESRPYSKLKRWELLNIIK